MKNEIIKDLKLLEKLNLTITSDVRNKIQIILAHCNKKYSDQGFYGHAALNRKILLDSVVSENLTSEVIRHVMSDKLGLAQLQRITAEKEIHIVPLKDAIINGLSEGLSIIESLPNNDESYCAKSRIQQKEDFQNNTRRILNAIQAASEREKPYFVDVVHRPTVPRFITLIDTLDLLKNNPAPCSLLEMSGYTPDQINAQMHSAFSRLCKKLEVNTDEKTVDEFCEQFLTYNDGGIFIDGDISHGFYDRLHLTAALISDEKLYFSNGIFGYRDLFQRIIEKINENPGAYPIAEEQISLRFSLIEQNLINNFSNILKEIKSREKFLRQGPVKEKNKAHDDVEYILHSLLEVEFPLKHDVNENGVAEHKEYRPQLPFNLTATISFNALRQINVTCPNGKTYNLSCALRNANLAYFRLLPETHEALLGKLDAKPGVSTVSLKTIYQIEELAIEKYTGNSDYKNMNALLRGFSLSTSDLLEIKKLIIDSLLAISGVNKNVDNNLNSKDGRTIVRLTDDLPINITSQMMMPFGFSYLTGLTSFSSLDFGAEYFQKKPISIRVNDTSGRLAINMISSHPNENEVLHPPLHLVFKPEKSQFASDGKLIISAEIVNGLATETTDHYLSELALIEFYEKNKKNRTLSPHLTKSEDMTLSHKIRVMSYIESVVEYFKVHAKNEFLKKYCVGLSHHDLEVIKIAAVFMMEDEKKIIGSVPGSEIRNLDQFLPVGQKAKFLQENLFLSSDEIELCLGLRTYAPKEAILSNSDYQISNDVLVKNSIKHIVTLAYWLDLARYLNVDNYTEITEVYRTNDRIIEISELQDAAFQQLQKQALYSIIKTGEQLAPGHMFQDNESNNESQRCNNDIFYCLARCEHAKLLSELTEEKKLNFGHIDNMSRLNQLVRKNISIVSSKVPDIDIFLKLELSNQELRILLDIFIPNLQKLDLTVYDLKALFEIPVISQEQRNLIFDAIFSYQIKENDIGKICMIFFQMPTITDDQRTNLLNFIIDEEILFSNDLKILFESKVISQDQQDKVIDFLSKFQSRPSLKDVLFLLGFSGITETQKERAVNNFIESIKNKVEEMDLSQVRLYLDFLKSDQETVFFETLSKSSKNTFFKLIEILAEDEILIYMPIWQESLVQFLNETNDSVLAAEDIVLNNIIKTEQIKFLLNCEKIKLEHRLSCFLLIKNVGAINSFFESSDHASIPFEMQLSLVQLKSLYEIYNKLKSMTYGYDSLAFFLKRAIKEPLNLERLNEEIRQFVN